MIYRNLFKKYIDIPFFFKVLGIVVPMIVQQAVTNFVSLLDNIMVGQLGTEPMSGVAIANQLFFVLYLTIFGITSSGGIFGAQFYGKGDYKGQGHSFLFRMYLSIICSALFIVTLTFKDTPLISLFLGSASEGADIDITLSFARNYVHIMLLGVIPFAISNSYSSTVKEMGQTIVPMISTLTAVAVNLILDYILIFGPGPFPSLGVQGAAIATVCARVIECLIIVIWTHTHTGECRFAKGVYKNPIIPGQLFLKMFISGMPLIINELLWSAGMSALIQCYSVRGLMVVAAFSISSTMNSVFSTVYLQLGVCISILVGQHLGSGKIQEAFETQEKLTFFSIVFGVLIGFPMAVLGRYFPLIYNTGEDVKMLAANFITVLGLFMPVFSLSNAYYFTLRSGGKTFFTMLFDSVYTWAIVFPVALVLSRFSPFGIVTVFVLVQSVDIIKGVLGYFMVRSRIWINDLT